MKCIYNMSSDKIETLLKDGVFVSRQALICFVLDDDKDFEQYMAEYSYLKAKCGFKPDNYIVIFNCSDKAVSRHRTGWNVTLNKRIELSKVERIIHVENIAKGEHLFETRYGDFTDKSVIKATAPVSKVKEAQSYAGEVKFDSYSGLYILYPLLAEHCYLQSFISEEMYNDFVEGRITSPYISLFETKLYQLQLIKAETIKAMCRDFKVSINGNDYVLRMYTKEDGKSHTLTKAYTKLYSWRSLFDF